MRYVSSKEMADIDSVAIKRYDIKIEEMMENAGRNLARFVSKILKKKKKVAVLFGKGNNGGGGLVAARHLAIQGKEVRIVGTSKNNNKNVVRQLSILKKMKIVPDKSIGEPDIIIDALIGYNLKGNPKGIHAELIKKANSIDLGVKIVSLDVPSGMDPNTGKCCDPCIDADYILTLALPKRGLKKLDNVYLANIGIPKRIYSDLGIRVGDYFSKGEIIKLS